MPGGDAAGRGDLVAPINALEARQDVGAEWRRAVNAALGQPYARLRGRLDALVFLKAPGFDVVLDWRCEQEAGLMGQDAVSPERRAALAVFIQHYERLSRHMMTGGVEADIIVALDRKRGVRSLEGGLGA